METLERVLVLLTKNDSMKRRLETHSYLKENLNLLTDGALVAQWLALLTSDLEGPGSNPG
jgi:hypothetical protein